MSRNTTLSTSTTNTNDSHRRASRSRTRQEKEERDSKCLDYSGPHSGTRSKIKRGGSDSATSSRDASRTRSTDRTVSSRNCSSKRKRLLADDMVPETPRGRSERRKPPAADTKLDEPPTRAPHSAQRVQPDALPVPDQPNSSLALTLEGEATRNARKSYVRPPNVGKNELASLNEDFLNEKQPVTGPEARMTEEMPGSGRKLWVCDKCFKYMQDLPSYKAHTVSPSSRSLAANSSTRLTLCNADCVQRKSSSREIGLRWGAMADLGGRWEISGGEYWEDGVYQLAS